MNTKKKKIPLAVIDDYTRTYKKDKRKQLIITFNIHEKGIHND